MSKRSLVYRSFSSVASGVVGIFVLLDMAAGPIVRPIARIITESGPIALVRRLSRRLPAYVALTFLAIPVAIAEPAKIFGLYLIGEEHYISGVLTLAGAYFVSLVLVDTIYEGARPQLRSITWFATVVDRVSAVRLAVMSRVRASRPYLAAQRAILRARAWVKRRRAKAVAR